LIEKCLTSPPTQYRLSERQFYRSKNPTNSIKVVVKENGYKSKEKAKTKYSKTINTHTHTKNTENSLVYNNTMG